MNWDTAVAWADGLSVYDSVRNVTYDDWRLPTTLQPDPSCYGQSGGDSYGNYCTGSEMGHLFNVDGISSGTPGLFTNLQPNYYWSGTEYAPDTRYAWFFLFSNGYQSGNDKVLGNLYALAVRSGDVAASVVPVPAAVWLFGSALAGLMGFRRVRR